MARYTGPSCRQCRREAMKLYLKGDRCYTAKCSLEKRNMPPGQHGASRKKPTQFAIQLREKQKLRRIYGLNEKQFKLTFEKAEKFKGVAGENFLSLLERRLDNVVYRMGFGSSRQQARQLVSHGHFLVNGRKVDVPSYIVRPGEVVTLKEKSREIPFIRENAEKTKAKTMPRWMEVDPDNNVGKITGVPSKEDFGDIQVDEKLVVEFYSR